TPYNISFSLKEPAAFRDGIMYCAQNGKKEALKALLNATAYKPKKIIMVDDKDHYVNEVIEAGKELGIEVVGIRYSQLDQKLKEFQLDHESKQLLKPPASKLIVEHTTIDAVKQYLVPGAVVIFDIDETVMRLQHDHQYGSSKWLQKLIQFASVEHGCGQEDIDRLILPHYYTAQEQAPVCAVEAHTVAFIKELQQTKVPVMALTARRLEVMEPTLRNLRALGIDFSVTAPLKEPTSFAINHPNLFIEGIMFCGGVQRTKENEKAVHAKDRAIKALFRHCNLKPTRVVVVDDNPAYLESIVDTIVSMGIDCVGIRYGACDHLRNTCVLDDASKDLVRSYVAAKAQEA
ncbi:DUF2608 domain-containing protein, partial [bacterium]|nr:DUF2608 domain-containing protein [bacterium]